MTLDQYLTSHHVTSTEFAGTIKVTVYAVNKWRARIRLPRRKNLLAIKKATQAEVDVKDWYE